MISPESPAMLTLISRRIRPFDGKILLGKLQRSAARQKSAPRCRPRRGTAAAGWFHGNGRALIGNRDDRPNDDDCARDTSGLRRRCPSASDARAEIDVTVVGGDRSVGVIRRRFKRCRPDPRANDRQRSVGDQAPARPSIPASRVARGAPPRVWFDMRAAPAQMISQRLRISVSRMGRDSLRLVAMIMPLRQPHCAACSLIGVLHRIRMIARQDLRA